VEHVDLTNHGKKAIRIKFNVEGTAGTGIVFAETREDMSGGEYVYLMVQVRRTGKVIVLQDRRRDLNLQAQDESGVLSGFAAGGSGSGGDSEFGKEEKW
jgi:hypothetical protein